MMGVELQSAKTQFATLMGDVRPMIQSQFVVWLDEKVAEFKVNGIMNLDSGVDAPKWIKNYSMSIFVSGVMLDAPVSTAPTHSPPETMPAINSSRHDRTLPHSSSSSRLSGPCKKLNGIPRKEMPTEDTKENLVKMEFAGRDAQANIKHELLEESRTACKLETTKLHNNKQRHNSAPVSIEPTNLSVNNPHYFGVSMPKDFHLVQPNPCSTVTVHPLVAHGLLSPQMTIPSHEGAQSPKRHVSTNPPRVHHPSSTSTDPHKTRGFDDPAVLFSPQSDDFSIRDYSCYNNHTEPNRENDYHAERIHEDEMRPVCDVSDQLQQPSVMLRLPSASTLLKCTSVPLPDYPCPEQGMYGIDSHDSAGPYNLSTHESAIESHQNGIDPVKPNTKFYMDHMAAPSIAHLQGPSIDTRIAMKEELKNKYPGMGFAKAKALHQYCCSLCGKQFLLRDSFSQHMTVMHSTVQYRCNHCDKVFRTKALLKEHISGMHALMAHERYRCPTCAKPFRWRSSLYTHSRACLLMHQKTLQYMQFGEIGSSLCVDEITTKTTV